MRNAFVKTLTELARKDERVFLVTADMGFSVFEDFQEKAKILPVNRITYDPNFWEGYMIIEPNAAIKEFRVK